MHDERASPLHLAIEARDLAAVKACLEAGASANAPNWIGVSALARAAQGGNHEIVLMLLAHGADVNNKERDGGLALHGSLRHFPDSRILDTLLERGLSPHVRVNGRTAVMEAADLGALEFVRRLVALGVDPHALSKDDRTALDEAVSRKRREVEAYLRGLGVEERHAARRALVKALLRAFGGKATEVSGGKWLLDPKRLGSQVQITVEPKSHRLAFHQLRFRARALRSRQSEVLRVRHRETRTPHLTTRQLFGAGGATTAAPGHRALPLAWGEASLEAVHRPDLADGAVDELRAACLAAESLLGALELAPGDELAVGFEAIVLQCAGHDPALAVRRVTALLRLVEHLAFDRTPPEPAIADALTIKVGPKLGAGAPSGRTGHRWGGLPTARLACPDCSARLGSVMRLDLSDGRLAAILPGRDSLDVLRCLDCGDWGPCFMDHSRAEPRLIEGEPADDEDLGEPPDLSVPARELRLEAAKTRSGARSRVGGAPSWLQGDETPACPRCLRPMQFALQLMSRADVAFGDDGRLYVFTCAGCRVSATMIQSH